MTTTQTTRITRKRDGKVFEAIAASFSPSYNYWVASIGGAQRCFPAWSVTVERVG